MNRPRGPYRRLLTQYLRPEWRLASVLTAIVLSTIGLQLLNPQILRIFIDDAQAGKSVGTLTAIAALFLAIALVTQLASVAETYVAENLGWIVTNRIRADLALHCLRLDPSFHNARTPGELIERIDGDVTTLSNFFSRFVIYLLGNALLVVGVLALLYNIDWRVGASMTVFVVVSVVVIRRLQRIATPYWTQARQASAELFGFLEERLAGTEDIRSSGATDYTMRRLYERCRNLLRRDRKAFVIGSTTFGGTWFLLWVAMAIALALGAYLFSAGLITIGTAYLIFYYTQMMSRPIDEMTRQFQDFQRAAAGIARVQQLFDLRSVIVDGSEDSLPEGPLSVELDRVSFAYEEDEPVLRDVSLYLAPGNVLGVVGRTGSGKTTMSRLLFRLYDPREGAVRLGGHDLRAVGVDGLRSRVGMVTQDIQLFHASVRDNLTFFDESVDDTRIEAVLADLGLLNWYRVLPRGLDTMVTGGATGLSAGEAQLLAFARVFLKDPGLVLLDEASSRLDPATERLIEHAVERLLVGRTGIIIAHRLSTLDRVDMILVLEDGHVVEYGDRATLAADPGSRFAALLRTGAEEALA